MRTSVYVDGYNLYYGALKGTPFRWLDVAAMCKAALQKEHVIHRIRYFTARVKPRADNPQVHNRQDAYLRALGTTPNLSIHFGHYLSHTVRMPKAPLGGSFVDVIKTEEKGSDVNLASYLLLDAFRTDFDAAVVVSNDSDLETPIHLVRRELGIDRVGVLNPHGGKPGSPAVALKTVAKFQIPILRKHVAASQFPSVIRLPDGKELRKPPRW
ncbi:hypothetical protein BH09MYX1_BH09MYX1_00970 [soil metagenome]